MCGRFALYSDASALAGRFGADALEGLNPRYNIAPTQDIPIVRLEGGRRRFAPARWGLVPSWAKAMDSGYSTFNARAETVADKPTFRAAFRHRRCLIPADGFYEWQARPGSKAKQPFFIALRDRQPMAFAGLWESWCGPDGAAVESCAIIVTGANELMRPIHDRMPVILKPGVWDAWLDPATKDAAAIQALLMPYPADGMTAWPVGAWVGNARNQGPECVEPVGAAAGLGVPYRDGYEENNSA